MRRTGSPKDFRRMSGVEKVLIVRLSSIGDVIHGLPVVRALKDAVPGIRIDWIVEKPSAALLESDADIDRVWVLKRGTGSAGEIIRQLRAVRKQQYDVSIDVQGLLKSALVARISGASRVVGFSRPTAREGSHLFYDIKVCGERPLHVVEKNLRLVYDGLRIDLPKFRWGVFTGDEPDQKLKRWIDETCPDKRKPVVLLNPGGTRPNKMWEGGHFAQLARLLAQDGAWVVVAWGPGEQGIAGKIVEVANCDGVVSAPSTNLRELASLIKQVNCVVSGDSAPLHLASAVGTPAVALFGSTDAARNGPYRIPSRTVRGDCSKGPCWQRECPERYCMRLISSIGVHRHVRAVLAVAGGISQ